MPDLKVGDTLYRFDVNHRVYPPVTAENKAKGDRWHHGAPIYRLHFRPVKITGETPGTWILEHGTVNKKTLLGRKTAYGQDRVHTLEQMEKQVYIHDNAKRIAHAVEYCDNVNLLKTIDRLVAG